MVYILILFYRIIGSMFYVRNTTQKVFLTSTGEFHVVIRKQYLSKENIFREIDSGELPIRSSKGFQY